MANKSVYGHEFSSSLVQLVWEKALPISGEDPRMFRRDVCGAIIRRDAFGDSSQPLSFGWEIDHIKPVTKGGDDEYLNLQPLQWENNRHKSDAFPYWDGKVTGRDFANEYTVR